ncbi:hypothetical protein PIB30_075933 [Stylosanthes scabra]|uniref:Uncharacterized protein n=1 Tax=Stylosanthes scabra TaxID=79078 RepID=A0ABU6XQI4_9FABA|nr:hypothetical protein [Stylosanthes scabra]
MEDLNNSNILLESSSEDLRVATADLSKHKKDVVKYGAALLKVKPLVDMGAVKEQEARLLEETQRLHVEELEKELLVAKQTLSSTMAGLAKIKASNRIKQFEMRCSHQGHGRGRNQTQAGSRSVLQVEQTPGRD